MNTGIFAYSEYDIHMSFKDFENCGVVGKVTI